MSNRTQVGVTTEKGLIAALNGYDLSRGTIEDRLNALEFEEARVTCTGLVIQSQSLTKRGNYCLFSFVGASATVEATVITIPQQYRPKTDTEIWAKVISGTSQGAVKLTVTTAGIIDCGNVNYIDISNSGWDLK